MWVGMQIGLENAASGKRNGGSYVFGAKTPAAKGWARKMGRLLMQANGPSRVWHSAAAIQANGHLSPADQEEYRKAYNYMGQRTQWMQYHT
jgi:hypothetical protein